MASLVSAYRNPAVLRSQPQHSTPLARSLEMTKKYRAILPNPVLTSAAIGFGTMLTYAEPNS